MAGSSSYYDPAGKTVTNGDTSDETDINNINTAIDSAFALVEAAIGAVDVSLVNYTTLASEWAEKAEDSEVTTGHYSALHHAAKSADSASTASTHASNASTSASNASTYASNASTSASNASTSETNAAASAVAAGVSETNAAASAASINVHRGAVAYIIGASIPNSALTFVDLTSELYDTSEIHSTSTNPSRMTVPAGVSKVILRGGLSTGPLGAAQLQFQLYGNNLPSSTITGSTLGGSSINEFTTFCSPVLIVSPGNFFYVSVFQNTGGSKSCNIWLEMQVVE